MDSSQETAASESSSDSEISVTVVVPPPRPNLLRETITVTKTRTIVREYAKPERQHGRRSQANAGTTLPPSPPLPAHTLVRRRPASSAPPSEPSRPSSQRERSPSMSSASSRSTTSTAVSTPTASPTQTPNRQVWIRRPRHRSTLIGRQPYPNPDTLTPFDASAFYVVTAGYQVGIFASWLETSPHVLGAPSNAHQSFPTWEEAINCYRTAYVNQTLRLVPRPSP